VRVLHGLLLGLAAGFLVAALLGVEREVSGLVVVGCLLLSLVLWLASAIRSGSTAPAGSAVRSGVRPVAVPAAGRPGRPPGTGPGGMFAGRALGDALAWVAREHGLHALYSVTVTEEEVDVLGSSVPGGPVTFLAITAGPGGWAADSDVLPGETDLGTGAGMVHDVFTAADLAPDVLSRLLDEARRRDVRPRVADADLAAVIDRPHGLRPDVTVRVAADDELTSATWWGTAEGRLLFSDQRAEI